MNINIIGVPLYYGCDKRGVEEAPYELEKSNLLGIFNEFHNITNYKKIQVPKAKVNNKFLMDSNMKYVNEINITNTILAEEVYEAVSCNSFPLIIGGDHSVALGTIAGTSKYFGEDYAIIWVDAHGDFNTYKTSFSKNIHGMPLAASIGIGHKSLTSIYYDRAKAKPAHIYILGCRDLDEAEMKLIHQLNIYEKSTSDIKNEGVENVVQDIFAHMKEMGIHNVHLSFDVDCIDPMYVPGTGTPVKEGLYVNEAKKILSEIIRSSLVKSMDFVEFNPKLDKNNRTRNVCLELLHTIAKELYYTEKFMQDSNYMIDAYSLV